MLQTQTTFCTYTYIHIVGIKRLFRQGIYTAYYPLHDGAYKLDKDALAAGNTPLSKRQELFYEWSRPGAFFKEQPYDAIRY